MTRDELESKESLLRMWMRRCAAHPMLEPAILRFMVDLKKLDHELRKPGDVRPTFEEDMDRWLTERENAIRNGRSAA